MRRALFFVGLCGAALATPGLAQFRGVNGALSGGPERQDPHRINYTYVQQLKLLRETALRRQDAAGGTLTEASRARLQAKLDEINAARRMELRRGNVWSVNAFGEKVAL